MNGALTAGRSGSLLAGDPRGERHTARGSALEELAGFADSAMIPLLLLAYMQPDDHSSTELRRLVLVLRELQAAMEGDANSRAVGGAAIRRLFAAASAIG